MICSNEERKKFKGPLRGSRSFNFYIFVKATEYSVQYTTRREG